jgi:hypothetical protein
VVTDDDGMREESAKLAELLEKQCSVVRRPQLLAADVTRARLRWCIAQGDWRAIGPTVVATQSGPLTVEQQRWAAVLLGGRGAALSGRTALTMLGLENWDDDQLHLLLPRGTRLPPDTGLPLVGHTTRRSILADRHPARDIPVLRLERAAIDAVDWTANPRTACGLLAAVVQQRLTTASRLLEVVGDSPCLRHHALVVAALRDIDGGAQALSEIDLTVLCRRFRLPTPRRQAVRVEPSGRRRFIDAEIEGPDGTVILVEVDGALHMQADRHADDLDRANELEIGGDRVLRFPALLIRRRPERVADQISRALGLGSISGRQDSR